MDPAIVTSSNARRVDNSKFCIDFSFFICTIPLCCDLEQYIMKCLFFLSKFVISVGFVLEGLSSDKMVVVGGGII